MKGDFELIKELILKEKRTSNVLFVMPNSGIDPKELPGHFSYKVIDENIERLNFFENYNIKGIFAKINGGFLPAKDQEFELAVVDSVALEKARSPDKFLSEIRRISKRQSIFFRNKATLRNRLLFLSFGTIDDETKKFSFISAKRILAKNKLNTTDVFFQKNNVFKLQNFSTDCIFSQNFCLYSSLEVETVYDSIATQRQL